MLIPPLERIFNLVGANVRQWFEDMPKPARSEIKQALVVASGGDNNNEPSGRYNIDEHFKRMECVVCKQPSDDGELTGDLARYFSR